MFWLRRIACWHDLEGKDRRNDKGDSGFSVLGVFVCSRILDPLFDYNLKFKFKSNLKSKCRKFECGIAVKINM